jgi:hypothetical protein
MGLIPDFVIGIFHSRNPSGCTVALSLTQPLTEMSKVKCTLVQALRLCTGRTAYRGSRGIALPFLDHGTRREWGVSVTPQPLFTPGKDTVPIVQEAGWAPGPVSTGAENLAPTGIRSPDCPARSSVAIPTELPDPQQKWVPGTFPGGIKAASQCIGLTTLLSSCADCLEFWESQPPGTLRACPGL